MTNLAQEISKVSEYVAVKCPTDSFLFVADSMADFDTIERLDCPICGVRLRDLTPYVEVRGTGSGMLEFVPADSLTA